MAIGEFGGAPVAPGGGGVLLSTPLYWLYEMSLCGAQSGAGMGRRHAAVLQESGESAFLHHLRKIRRRRLRTLRALDAPVRPARVADFLDPRRRRARADSHFDGMGAAVLPARSFRARVRTPSAAPAAEAPPRRAAVRALPDAAARHGRSVSPQSRGLHHRVGQCEHGAARGGELRPRRLHRLSDLDPARARRRHACDRRVPAVGAGVGRGRADGGGRRSLRPALHGADGRTDRHQGQPHRGEQTCRAAWHRLVPPQRDHQGAVPQSGLHARRLSGLPPAQRLRQHESRPAHRGAQAAVSQSRPRRRRLRAKAQGILRRVSGGDGPLRRILPADRRHRVRAPRAAARPR